MHGCNVLIQVRYSAINRQFDIILCVFLRSWDAKEYSCAVWEALLRCLRSENRTELRWSIYIHVCSSLTTSYWHFFTFYETCSKCMLAYVPLVHMYVSNLPNHTSDSFWMNLLPNHPSLTFSSCFYLLMKMSIDFRLSFWHTKQVLVSRLVFVSEKKLTNDKKNCHWYYTNKHWFCTKIFNCF